MCDVVHTFNKIIEGNNTIMNLYRENISYRRVENPEKELFKKVDKYIDNLSDNIKQYLRKEKLIYNMKNLMYKQFIVKPTAFGEPIIQKSRLILPVNTGVFREIDGFYSWCNYSDQIKDSLARNNIIVVFDEEATLKKIETQIEDFVKDLD